MVAKWYPCRCCGGVGVVIWCLGVGSGVGGVALVVWCWWCWWCGVGGVVVV